MLTEKDLKKGNILPIYFNYQEQKKPRGNALLIKKVKSRITEEEKEFIIKEVGDKYNKNRKRAYKAPIWSYQDWIVEFVDGPQKGFRTQVKIAYYKRTFFT